MARSLTALLSVATVLAVIATPALAGAFDDEYAAMRTVPGADRDFERTGLAPCATPCPDPCRHPCEPACPPKCWDWRVGLWMWLPGMDGTTVLGGQEADVDFDWTDWFDNLDKVDFVLQAVSYTHLTLPTTIPSC